MISIVVAYAAPKRQVEIPLQIEANCTVLQAIMLSGILSIFPEIDLTSALVGIFGKRVTLQTTVSQHDRIEIYRRLRNDPKENRRARVQSQKRP